MMELKAQNELYQHMTDLQKTSLNAAFNTMELVQNRSEKMMRLFWNQMEWISEKFTQSMVDFQKSGQAGMECWGRNAGVSLKKLCLFPIAKK